MTAPDHLPPVTFRRTISQRVLQVYGGLAAIVLGGLALVLEPPILPPPLMPLLGIFALALGIFMLANLNPRTVIDADGVHVASLFRRRSCRWSEVADVTCRLGDDGAADGEVKIRTLKGRSFALPAPAPAQSLGRNPEFRRQLDTIRIYWRSAQ
jgi:Bacterial PH domain